MFSPKYTFSIFPTYLFQHLPNAEIWMRRIEEMWQFHNQLVQYGNGRREYFKFTLFDRRGKRWAFRNNNLSWEIISILEVEREFRKNDVFRLSLYLSVFGVTYENPASGRCCYLNQERTHLRERFMDIWKSRSCLKWVKYLSENKWHRDQDWRLLSLSPGPLDLFCEIIIHLEVAVSQ